MNKKTSAEMQIEFLKKLKQTTSEPPLKAIKAKPSKPEKSEKSKKTSSTVENEAGITSSLPSWGNSALSLEEIPAQAPKKLKKMSRVSLPAAKVDKSLLAAVKMKNAKSKYFKNSGQLFDWLLELGDAVPMSLSELNIEGRKDFYKAAKQWLSQRGVKDE